MFFVAVYLLWCVCMLSVYLTVVYFLDERLGDSGFPDLYFWLDVHLLGIEADAVFMQLERMYLVYGEFYYT